LGKVLGKIRIFLENFWEKSEFFWENFRKSQDIFGKILEFFWENQDFLGNFGKNRKEADLGMARLVQGF
jgi:hypothetical protein